MNSYELLWECFMSEQMTAVQLEKHMIEDPDFKIWVENKVKQQFEDNQ